jgi:NADH-quinone oxidoreductase subunit J
VIEMVFVLLGRIWGAVPAPAPANYSNTKALGRVLYTQYAYAFEIAAVVLLVAIIAAIALTLRKRKDSRHQAVSEQLKARRAERVRLVSMPAEKE